MAAGTTKSTEIYMDEMHMESMMCGDLFDHIDDLLEFPNDTDADIMMMGGMMMDPSCTHAALPFPPPPPPLGQDHEPHLIPPLQVEADDVLLGAKGDAIMNTGPGNNTGTTTTLNQEDDRVFENLEISDMDWFTNFIYDTADSFSLGFPTTDDDNNSNNNNNNIKEDQSMFRTSSPVSVLESNSISGGSGGGGGGSSTSSSSSSSFSSSNGDNVGDRNGGRGALLPPSSIPESVVPARARSKRPRTTTFSPRTHVTISFLPPSPDSPDISLPAVADPESFGESINPPTVICTAVKKNTTKKKKNKMQLSSDSGGEESVGGPPAARKCTHCQIQKTPQWRAGPLGPKTLCNACGVRYKSGRLFPEYRPAASPTFVPSIHSNSHKKVVEMRLKTTVPAESCDLLDYIRRKE